MIAARYSMGRVFFEQGPELTYSAAPGVTPAEYVAERDRLAQLFAKPARVAVSSEPEPGAIADGSRMIPPGSADHARAVMQSLDGAVIELDEDG